MDEDGDRRSSKRRRTVLRGRVVFNNRSSVLDCTVRDLSDTGAQLTLADVSALPPDFDLEIPGKSLQVQADPRTRPPSLPGHIRQPREG
jgi:hypothetical protein